MEKKSLPQDVLEKLIKKMLVLIKPNGVLSIEFSLEKIFDEDDEYYMTMTYIVPDDSPYLTPYHRTIKIAWNTQIRKTIESYFGVRVIINNTSVSSETFHKKFNH